MAWENVYNLLISVGGKAEILEPAALEAATAEGPGDKETQLRIAVAIYNNPKRKESHEQGTWQFG